MLEFYTGAACSLCDPDWTRYSTQQPDGAWVVTVREENCHYLWAACSKVLRSHVLGESSGRFGSPDWTCYSAFCMGYFREFPGLELGRTPEVPAPPYTASPHFPTGRC